jgi:hypothetical protein
MTDLLKELEALANQLEMTPDNQVMFTHEAAKTIRSLIAAEKARGPDPLLVQAREALRFVEPQYQRALELMRKVGWKFEDADDLDQKVAFSVYTYLVKCCEKARPALAALDERMGRKA